MGGAAVAAAGSAPAAVRAAGVGAGSPLALAPVVADGAVVGLALAAPEVVLTVPTADVAEAQDVVRRVHAEVAPRWVWWSGRGPVERRLLPALGPLPCWDLGAVHLLLAGGGSEDPAHVWAGARGLPPTGLPVLGQLDLLSPTDTQGRPGDPDDPVRPDGYLRPEWAATAASTPARAARWARLALEVQAVQEAAVAALPDTRRAPEAPALPVLTAWSESAAEALCAALTAAGLPLDRRVAERLLEERIGPRAADLAAETARRGERDQQVLRHLPPGTEVDLRNPAQVRSALARVGVDVPDTRSWRLEPLRGTHPVVDALLTWRKAERIATTYGWSWLDRHVGPDGRLRGVWTGSDGAAGRMTATAGLHNLPAELRPAVVAEPGHVLVRADLGQVEPRVLAAVSGDEAFAAAARADDLYSPVAQRIGCARDVAKVAVLAAMYGQTSGAAGTALAGLDRAYPRAMRHLRQAEEEGRSGRDVRTYGGRLVRMYPLPDPPEPAALTARGRFARNAVVQGSAAELFKMWAVTVRAALAAAGSGELVLCLHDELLVQAPDDTAQEVVAVLHATLADTARRWSAGSPVRFVADVAVGRSWAEAKVAPAEPGLGAGPMVRRPG